MGVSKNRGGPPKWMVYNGKTYFQMDDLGGFTTPIFGSTHPYGQCRATQRCYGVNRLIIWSTSEGRISYHRISKIYRYLQHINAYPWNEVWNMKMALISNRTKKSHRNSRSMSFFYCGSNCDVDQLIKGTTSAYCERINQRYLLSAHQPYPTCFSTKQLFLCFCKFIGLSYSYQWVGHLPQL